MITGAVQIVGWVATIAMAIVVLLLAWNRQAGLRLLGHRPEMLPQAMLVRYGGMALMAALAAWLNRPSFVASVLFVFAMIGVGDAIIYCRAGHPFRLHLIGGGAALAGAAIALFCSKS